ncbi:aquaporin NIP4-1-like isoform X2 [Hordeum vulgare subsp. vulgare]|uniref:aquaporin NIP4-1-like isoform X2 n=1 Tax=Hordeum vulgare subsp. vulgare TaxID=112509 RepID=UPI001D1A39F2|nr:aquaporin NIP4-1-like isoform X2 [Hordeum vulgare subsp. vulgare]
MDLDKTNTVAGDGAANGHDVEQARRGQEPAPPPAGHATKGLAVGHLIRELVLEGVATFLVVFWSCVAALMQEMHHGLTFPTVCLVVALTVAFVLGWMGPAHLNPAVTVTFAAFRYFPWRKLPLYVAMQIGASVLACLSVNAMMEPHEDNFYGTVPRPPGAGARLPFLLELLASAVLMIVIATVARSSSKAVGGIAIGAAVGTLGLVIGPVSGGSMNPARSLGPAIVFGRYTSIWIYVTAPVAGMLLGALCNMAVRQSDVVVGFLCGGRGASSRVVVVGRSVA